MLEKLKARLTELEAERKSIQLQAAQIISSVEGRISEVRRLIEELEKEKEEKSEE